MSSDLSSLQSLFVAIQERATELNGADERTSLSTILILSIEESMSQIRRGSNPDEFQDLTILNLIMRGNDEGYSKEELRAFVLSLKKDNSL